MDSLSAFDGAGWGHVSHSLYATVRSGPGPSTPTSLFLKTCRETIQAGPARERERSSRQDAREIANGGTNSVSGIPPAGFAGLSLARQAPTKPHSIERFGASDNPGPWRTGRSTGSVQGRIHSVPGRAEHRHATPDGGRELPEKGLWNPAGWLAPPFRGRGPLLQI